MKKALIVTVGLILIAISAICAFYLHGAHEEREAVADLDSLILDVEYAAVLPERLANFCGWCVMRVVELDMDDATDSAMRAIAQFSYLEKFYLALTDVGNRGASHLANMHKLVELDLAYTAITDDGLVAVKHLTNLETLELSGLEITSASATVLANLTKLSKLVLTDTGMNSEAIAQLSNLIKLQHLSLDLTQADDNTIAKLTGLQNLEYLNLNQTKVSDAAIPALLKLKNLKVLQAIDSQITAEGAAQLRQANPELKVTVKRPARKKTAMPAMFKKVLEQQGVLGKPSNNE